MTREKWIEMIAPLAQKAMRKFGYRASVLIAQTCQENGFGMDESCEVLVAANNVLGMKRELLNNTWTSEYWDGDYIIKQTPEWEGGKMILKEDSFRRYDSIEKCLYDYCQFMRDAKLDNGEYKYRDVLQITDPHKLIIQVKTRGYCTDPTYDYAVIKIVQDWNLTRFDNQEVDMSEHEIIDITDDNTPPRLRGNNALEWIVVHFLGVPNADNPYLFDGGKGGHYNVTRKGVIYLVVNPLYGVVWHCGGGLQGDGGHEYFGICTNWNSIGVECGVCADTTARELPGDSDLWYFSEETQESCAWLVAKLMREHGIDIDHVIRHYDVTGKICPNPYVLNNRRKTSWTWEEFKQRVMEIYCGAQSEGGIFMTFKTVHMGDTGEDVLTMQRLLYAQDYKGKDGKPLSLDGDFGINSDYALKAFQSDHGLDPDGWCGPLSWTEFFGKAA